MAVAFRAFATLLAPEFPEFSDCAAGISIFRCKWPRYSSAMPVIPAKKNNWSDLFLKVLMLWFNPNSPRIDKRFIDQMIGHFYFAGSAIFPEHVKIGPKELKLIHGAPPRGVELPSDFDIAIRHGFIAGAVLFNTLRLAVHDENKASVENAIRLVADHLEKSGEKGRRATIMKAWSSHKPISPFWAAAISRMDIFREMNRAMSIRISRKAVMEASDTLPFEAKMLMKMLSDIPKLKSGIAKADELLPQMCAVAERMREMGEMHFAPGQKVRGKPTLEKSLAWRVPKSFDLPHVKIKFPRLSPAEKRALLQARTRKKA